MVELINYFNSIQPLSDEATAGLLRVMKAKELRRGQVWLQEGAVCDKMTFVVKGLLKLYFEVGSKEVVLAFARPIECILSFNSYFDQVSSNTSIRAVEPSIIVYITRSELTAFVERYPEINAHMKIIVEKEVAAYEYHLALLLMPPRARFTKILSDKLWMGDGKAITDRLLAAYLGIGANVLSAYRSSNI